MSLTFWDKNKDQNRSILNIHKWHLIRISNLRHLTWKNILSLKLWIGDQTIGKEDKLSILVDDFCVYLLYELEVIST